MNSETISWVSKHVMVHKPIATDGVCISYTKKGGTLLAATNRHFHLIGAGAEVDCQWRFVVPWGKKCLMVNHHSIQTSILLRTSLNCPHFFGGKCPLDHIPDIAQTPKWKEFIHKTVGWGVMGYVPPDQDARMLQWMGRLRLALGSIRSKGQW